MKSGINYNISNETEVAHFITRVYEVSSVAYERCISRLKEYRTYFPSVQDCAGGSNPGKLVIEHIFTRMPGYDNPARRVLLKRIKDVFKYCYLEAMGVPQMPNKLEGIRKFKENHLSGFLTDIVECGQPQKPLLLEYLFHSLSSAVNVLWVDVTRATTEEEFTVALWSKFGKQTHPAQLGGMQGALQQLFSNENTLFVVAGLHMLHANRLKKEIIKQFLLYRKGEFSQMLFLEPETSAEHTLSPLPPSEVTNPSWWNKLIGSSPSRFWLFAVAFCMICLVITATLFISNMKKNEDKELVFHLKYFGDEVQQDNFYGGVLLTGINNHGKVLTTVNNAYLPVFSTSGLPDATAHIIISKGSHEVYPDTIPFSDLSDTIYLVVYRSIRLADNIVDTIGGSNSQRWYTFTLQEPTTVSFTCRRVSGNLSPQIAIFTDRFGNDRVLGNQNHNGDLAEVQLSGWLPTGKYYLKVRGYDNSQGAFMVCSAKI